MRLIGILLALAHAWTLTSPGLGHVVERLPDGIPRFEDFPAPPAFRGDNAAPNLSDPDARRYRTRLRAGAKEEPNYAGIHNLVLWGCGTACLWGAAVNAVTGRVVFLPNSTYELHARLDSRLLILSGYRGADTEVFCFFDFDGRSFRLVHAMDLGIIIDPAWPAMNCASQAGIDRTPDGKVLIVHYSHGGSVDDFERTMVQADRSGSLFRIEGPCHSACTIFLSAKNVCIADTAEIGVHGASTAGKVDPILTQEWARKYHPPALRAWAEQVGAYASHEMTTIAAPDLWAMGFDRCKPLSDDVRRELAERRARDQAEIREMLAVNPAW